MTSWSPAKCSSWKPAGKLAGNWKSSAGTYKTLRVCPYPVGELWVPRTSSTSRDQAIFVDQATDASLSSCAVLLEIVAEAFSRAQDTIVEVAKSTARVIERAGAGARPDRVEVEFGLSFSASGGVIMAGVAGAATLKVTLGYDVGARPAAAPLPEPPSAGRLSEPAPDSSS